jgi:hypothetical protein
MVVNFRVHEISRGARKLTQTPSLIIKKKRYQKQQINKEDSNIIWLLISGPMKLVKVRTSRPDTLINNNKKDIKNNKLTRKIQTLSMHQPKPKKL